MPYSDPAARRRVQRESQRRRRARQRGAAAVNPSTRSGAAPLSPADLAEVVASELRAVQAASPAGGFERARVIVALVGAALKCFEMSDLTARVEQLERLFENLPEDGRKALRAV